MSQFQMYEFVAADVTTPPNGAVMLFIDADSGYPAFKDSTGAVFILTSAALTALAAVSGAADTVAYFTGASTASTTALTTYGRTLIGQVNAAAARSALGLAIGTDVQAWDAELAAIAALVSAANKIILFTGSGTASLLDYSTSSALGTSDTTLVSQHAIKDAISAAVAGLSWKQAVRAATTGAGTLATSFENGDTIDGVTLATGDRILIKNQSAGAENGIYVVAASGAPSRATDADSGAEMVNASVYVSEGTVNADTQWTCTANATITLGSTSLVFSQLSTGGAPSGAAGGDLSGTYPNPTVATVDGAAVQSGTVPAARLGSGSPGSTTFLRGDGAWASIVGGGAGSTTPGWLADHPDNEPASPNVADDEFGGTLYAAETSLDTGGTRFTSATAWAWVNQGTATAVLAGGVLRLKSLAHSGNDIKMIMQTIPAGTWRYRAKVSHIAFGATASMAVQMVLRQSSSGKLTAINLYYSGNYNLSVSNYTDPTTYSADVVSPTAAAKPSGWYLEIENDGTNYIYRASPDGFAYFTLGTQVKTAFLTTTGADQIGIAADSNNGSSRDLVAQCEWFRRVA
jgi:hypothetical protein